MSRLKLSIYFSAPRQQILIEIAVRMVVTGSISLPVRGKEDHILLLPVIDLLLLPVLVTIYVRAAQLRREGGGWGRGQAAGAPPKLLVGKHFLAWGIDEAGAGPQLLAAAIQLGRGQQRRRRLRRPNGTPQEITGIQDVVAARIPW